MNETQKISRRRAAYVSAVEAALAQLSDVDRKAVLSDVNDHIDTALADSGASRVEALERILADLGSPESFAQGIGSHEPAMMNAGPQISGHAVWGMSWSLLALLAAPFTFFATFAISIPVEAGEAPSGPDAGQWLLMLLCLFGSAGLIGGPVLSLNGLSRILASSGQLGGLSLATVGVWVPPLFAIDALLVFAIAVGIDGTGWEQSVKGSVVLLTIAALLMWNLFFLRRTNRRYSREMAVR